MYRIIMLFCVILSLACGNAETRFDTEDYEKTKESLAEMEKKHPERFLIASSSEKKNLIGQTVVRGTLFNKATTCLYKDVQVKISFFSKTGVLLEENKETVYEIVPPNQQVKFKSKFFAPKGTDSVAITILDAKVETGVAE